MLGGNYMENFKFDNQTIRRIFGEEDAAQEDDERLKSYFIKNSNFEDAISDQNIVLLVGHKGSGKSATVKHSYNELRNSNIAIVINPTDILAGSADLSDQNYNAVVALWQERIQHELAKKILNDRFNIKTDKDIINKIARKSGDVVSSIMTALRRGDRSRLSLADDAIIENFLNEENSIFVFIDDLDQGWTSTENDIRKMSAILSAFRAITSRNQKIKIRVTLRTDIYTLMRTSDESTDKTEGSVSWVKWDGQDILSMISKRILVFFGERPDDEWLKDLNQKYISENILSRVMDPKFAGKGHWAGQHIHNVLASLTRRSRPRDLVKLLTLAAREAGNKSNIISSVNLENAFEKYSTGRLQDTENEFKSELPKIGNLLRGMKPNKQQRRASDNWLYSLDTLVSKVDNIRSNSPFQFTNGTIVTSKSLIQFMYKIDFVTGRKRTDEGIVRRHFDDNQFLITEVNDMGFEWEVHPAFRWALQPDDPMKIMDSIEF